jgi:hypothetical protein
MKSIVSRIALLLAGAVLLGMALVMTTGQLEYCGTVNVSKSHAPAAPACEPVPTLAPPPSMVVVKVEADRPDIHVGWLDN